MELQSFNRSDGATASVDLFADIDLATQQGQADCKEARMNPREDLEDILRGTAFEIDGRSHPSEIRTKLTEVLPSRAEELARRRGTQPGRNAAPSADRRTAPEQLWPARKKDGQTERQTGFKRAPRPAALLVRPTPLARIYTALLYAVVGDVLEGVLAPDRPLVRHREPAPWTVGYRDLSRDCRGTRLPFPWATCVPTSRACCYL